MIPMVGECESRNMPPVGFTDPCLAAIAQICNGRQQGERLGIEIGLRTTGEFYASKITTRF